MTTITPVVHSHHTFHIIIMIATNYGTYDYRHPRLPFSSHPSHHRFTVPHPWSPLKVHFLATGQIYLAATSRPAEVDHSVGQIAGIIYRYGTRVLTNFLFSSLASSPEPALFSHRHLSIRYRLFISVRSVGLNFGNETEPVSLGKAPCHGYWLWR